MTARSSRRSRTGTEVNIKASRRPGKRWISTVTSVSTSPPKGLFTRDPETISRSLASKKVSPKGPASGMRMLTFFINRAGKGLSANRRAKLERAKVLLSARVRRESPSKRKHMRRKAA